MRNQYFPYIQATIKVIEGKLHLQQKWTSKKPNTQESRRHIQDLCEEKLQCSRNHKRWTKFMETFLDAQFAWMERFVIRMMSSLSKLIYNYNNSNKIFSNKQMILKFMGENEDHLFLARKCLEKKYKWWGWGTIIAY